MSPASTPDPGADRFAPHPPAAVLVIGAGNLLLGDEGAGIHALRLLARTTLPRGVRLLDGGTGGISLLGEFEQARCVVFIDATRDGRPAGTVSHLRPERVADLPRHLSAHDFGVRDLFAAAALLEQLPLLHVFTISVEEVQPMCLELTPKVAAALPEVVRRVEALCRELIGGSGAVAEG